MQLQTIISPFLKLLSKAAGAFIKLVFKIFDISLSWGKPIEDVVIMIKANARAIVVNIKSTIPGTTLVTTPFSY